MLYMAIQTLICPIKHASKIKQKLKKKQNGFERIKEYKFSQIQNKAYCIFYHNINKIVHYSYDIYAPTNQNKKLTVKDKTESE